MEGHPMGMRTASVARTVATALGFTTLLATALAGPAAAGVNDRGPWTNEFTDVVCDAGYLVDGDEQGHVRVLDPTPANPEFFRFQNWYAGHTTITNAKTGATFSEEWSGDFREHSIERQPGGGYVYRYQTTDSATYKVRDSRGHVVYTEHGRVVASYLFDTVGDGSYGAPGGTYLEDPVELENTWDPTFDFCALADSLIG
jgi:hypothetical protein